MIKFGGILSHVQSDDDNLQDVYVSTVPRKGDEPK